jgi:hypothetical protein
MRKTKLALALLLVAGSAWASDNHGNNNKQAGRHVDLVIALDTSSSMDGLIDSARAKLWDVVNLLGQARPQPLLRVGLISYGNDGYDSRVGWVRKELDLTTDLDGVYSKLFALKTNGGTEYVARAVKVATDQMQWDPSGDALKIVFVAGNEPADQDRQFTVDQVVGAARQKNIFVNAIYCGSQSNGESVGWQHVANKGAGKYAAIDQNHIVAIATPMDGELQKLSEELNGTYVAYGRGGKDKAANQVAQDANAVSSSPAAAASRASAKSRAVYRNDDWDIVDARSHGKVGAGGEGIAAAELPPEMQKMGEKERTAFLDGKAKQRAELQKKIEDASKRRDAFIVEARKKAAKSSSAGLDDALMGAVKTEAQSAGFAF